MVENLDSYSKPIALELDTSKAKKDFEKFDKWVSSFGKGFTSISSALGKGDKSLSKILTGFSGGLQAGLTNVGQMFVKKIADTFTDAWSELKKTMSASYLTNNTTWSNMTNWGMTSSQSQAFEQTKSLLGITSEDQLYRMSSTQQRLFVEGMTEFTEKYNELADQGFYDEMLTYQFEMGKIQQELNLSVGKFFVENKEVIIGGMKAIVWVADKIMDLVSALVDLFTVRSETTPSVSDVIGTQTTVTWTTNNNFNGVSESTANQVVDSQKSIYRSITQKLKNI